MVDRHPLRRTCVPLSWARTQEPVGCPGHGMASPVDSVQKLGLLLCLPCG